MLTAAPTAAPAAVAVCLPVCLPACLSACLSVCLVCLRPQGLYLLDMSQPMPVAKMLEGAAHPPETNYCEVKWCSTTGRLLAASGQTSTFELWECKV